MRARTELLDRDWHRDQSIRARVHALSMRPSAWQILCVIVLVITSCSKQPQLHTGSWRAWLDSPGGELPFGLELQKEGGMLQAWLVNGAERIPVSETRFENGELVLAILHYDSEVRAKLSSDATRLDGRWKKRSGTDSWSQLDFHATQGEAPRFTATEAEAATDTMLPSIAGRWAVDFASEDHPAVGIFEDHGGGVIAGTFLTATGDYRYLAGKMTRGRLRLSCFDGAHAFLFDASLQADSSLAGDFWSRDTWHETWTARRNDAAELPDAMQLTRWKAGAALEELSYPDLQGRKRSLADPEFVGQARLIEVFGSWCPNCNDAAGYLVELHRRYRDRGLTILGLAFEITGDLQRDTAQVQRYAEIHGIEFPILIAGMSDKAQASKAFPALDRVRAFPTTIFMDRNNQVRAIHTGFSGPATGTAHDELRQQFEALIEELLAEK